MPESFNVLLRSFAGYDELERRVSTPTEQIRERLLKFLESADQTEEFDKQIALLSPDMIRSLSLREVKKLEPSTTVRSTRTTAFSVPVSGVNKDWLMPSRWHK